MGKRSNFERRERDFYPTPYEAVIPLMNHIATHDFNGNPFRFAEPCAGNGVLVNHLESFGLKCYWASDIDPQLDGIVMADALTITNPLQWSDMIITNPPWDRKILHPMIEHFKSQNEVTWLLFDADWMHTKQAIPYIKYCHTIVSIGRVKWVPESKKTGKDNCCWYKFVQHETKTQFIGR